MFQKVKPIVICINAPPGSGKDYLGDKIISSLGGLAVKEKMAAPIEWAIKNAFQFDDEMWQYLREEGKEGPIVPSSSTTLRQAMISFSEDHMKPMFGKDIFGRLLAERAIHYIRYNDQPVVVVTDCGFNIEYKCLYQRMVEDNVRTLLVRIERQDAPVTAMEAAIYPGSYKAIPGGRYVRQYTFENDSREWVSPINPLHFLIWENDGTDQSAEHMAGRVFDCIMENY